MNDKIFFMNDYVKIELSNKIRLITVPMKGISSATVLVLVGAGSRYEKPQKAGLSHFLEHMIFKGTKKRPTALEISTLIDSVGGENNAFTSKDQTGYYMKVNSEHLELTFDILSDILRNSLFLPEEIEREKGTIIEEINLYEDTPMYKIDNVFYELMYNGNPLGWPTAGTKETVLSINQKDFFDYANRFYQGKDMVIVAAGNVNPQEIKELSQRYFSLFEVGEKENFEEVKMIQKEPRVKISYKKTDQAHLYFGYPAFSFLDPDRPVLSVLNAILGGGMSSRLFIQVRGKRGLAYYISSFTDLYHETGFIAARAGLNLEKVDEAIKIIIEEFEKIKEGDIDEKELNKAKEFLKGRTTLNLENSHTLAEWYGEKELLYGRVETPKELFDKIDKVSTGDIKRVANRIFDKSKRNLAIVGPFNNEDRFLKLLKEGLS